MGDSKWIWYLLFYWTYIPALISICEGFYYIFISQADFDIIVLGYINNREAVITKIAKDYYISHTYSIEDTFVCRHMAIDMWNMVKTAGIPAKIVYGVKENSIPNHVWVIAEIVKDKWLAIECTAGVISRDPKYYTGIMFDTVTDRDIFLRNAEIIYNCDTMNEMDSFHGQTVEIA